jgi:hypothetical protein
MPARDPGVRRASTRLAATVRWHPDADTTELAEDLARARRDADIAKMVATWPPLTPEQREKLALLLHPGGAGNG